jgi:hypothetical protein
VVRSAFGGFHTSLQNFGCNGISNLGGDGPLEDHPPLFRNQQVAGSIPAGGSSYVL